MIDLDKARVALGARIEEFSDHYKVYAITDTLNFAYAKKVSEVFGTDFIDFTAGEHLHEPGYSSLTPSYSFDGPACFTVYK